ncbi:type I-U CRISPR-associated RAMP protein Csb1/Cas7u [Trichocoleus sp. DQ-A3]|uniref:type I-G CRISPR-associated RAMP protein Csb1/Cas7g n=1 Tax=Cyanophyceae TaxID=3028117 RepID=UPI001684440A|nr:type I-U CRISPR-associated RAMP protein Csb1/Cas7u [Coleofasciculus sp. FACHB-125]MBD1903720.1 type I-U CRISPR-associated protein Cas7 [Coleofasciculus sp. FACHB-125]
MSFIKVDASFESLLYTVKPPSFLDVGISQAYLPWGNRHDVLLNSPQATANQFEALIWDSAKNSLISELEGLPYVEIINSLTGKFAASTLTLPHRIGTAYLARHKDAKLGDKRFRDVLKENVKTEGIYPAVFSLDPMSIVLGCFLSHIQGSMRIPRVLSGQFIAQNAIAMPTGGASIDPISAAGDSVNLGHFVKEKKVGGKVKVEKITKASSIGLGNVPYVRESFTAEEYSGKFVIDNRLVEQSNLKNCEKQLVFALSKYLLAKFLNSPIMLRSECYLELSNAKYNTVDGTFPSSDEALKEVQVLIKECGCKGKTTVKIPIELVESNEDEEEAPE